MEKFKIEYFEENALQINELITILSNDQLTDDQWQTSCSKLDHMIQKISDKIQETCSAPPLPTLTNRTSQQGGFLPRKLQKTWKKHLSTYHLIRKTIYITKNTQNWQTHPIIEELKTHTNVTIPPLPTQEHNQQEWIQSLVEIAKTAKIQARKITTKYTQSCIKKAISKIQTIIRQKPKENKQKSFQKSRNTTIRLHYG